MVAAVLVVVVGVVLVLVQRVDRTSSDDPAAVSAPAQTPFSELPTVPVDTPPVTPEAEAACPALMSSLPPELAGEQSRRVESASPYAYAWGDPPITMVCGTPPTDYPPDAFLVTLNQVTWSVDLSDPDVYVYSSVDRTVPITVRVPSSEDSATVTALGPLIAASIPYVEPAPRD
ncbi:DUF3515 family protein [Modestobacter sp. I12A-02628]|uniref:DUF3515 family protein n=1 Tax=Goekera deserti TaxID=2497753 RepID=A0A7K3WGX9_9ACTN|nr:DUF3515 family protein [Goekera deserti]NDI50187.1 DUF3515 family protein [Goekera deserti]NEL55755.1 DUF3515 family protein [Goekera deserti]